MGTFILLMLMWGVYGGFWKATTKQPDDLTPAQELYQFIKAGPFMWAIALDKAIHEKLK